MFGLVFVPALKQYQTSHTSQTLSSHSEVERISTSSAQALKMSFNQSSSGSTPKIPPRSAFTQTQNDQIPESPYSYPQFNPQSTTPPPRLTHRRLSNNNTAASQPRNTPSDVPMAFASNYSKPFTTLRIDKPPPPARNRNQTRPKQSQNSLEQQNLTENTNGHENDDENYLQFATPGGDDGSASPYSEAEDNHFDHGWKSVNDIVKGDNVAEDDTEVDTNSAPDVNDPKAKQSKHDRSNGASWSPPGSLENA